MNKASFRKLLDQIPFQRLMIYLIVLGFVPVTLAGLHYLHKKREWNQVSEQIITIHNLSEMRARKQYLNTIVRHSFAEVDPGYIENQLEALPLLKKETENLEHLLRNPTFTGNEAAEKRYVFLTSQANKIQLLQSTPQLRDGLQEIICALSHPVEVDIQDLKEILTRIEGNRKGKPQLILTDFKLNKKTHSCGNEVFELNMKILKREYPT